MSAGSLLIVTGPPGAGKSAVGTAVAAAFGQSILVAGDAFFGFVASGAIDPWRPEAHRQNTVVIEAAASAAGRFAMGGFATIYDGIVGPWFLPHFAAATGLRSLDYVMLLPSIDVCIERVRSRAGHRFTDLDATRHMHAEFAGCPIDGRHVLTDPSGHIDAVADEITQRRRHGTLTYATPVADPH